MKSKKKRGLNLVVDQGNTLTKLALFEDDRIIDQLAVPSVSTDALAAFIAQRTIDKAIFSSVRSTEASDFAIIQTIVPSSIRLSNNLNFPFTIAYSTPNTLGKDRIAAVAGALRHYPNENLLVIDAGTAITYELVTASGNYLGGNIAPGMQMRFKSLNAFTGKLPLCGPVPDAPLMGHSTQTAIAAGVQNSMVFEIEGYIGYLTELHCKLRVLMTGGDAEYLAERVKRTIFVYPNLVLEGLNSILHHNA